MPRWLLLLTLAACDGGDPKDPADDTDALADDTDALADDTDALADDTDALADDTDPATDDTDVIDTDLLIPLDADYVIPSQNRFGGDNWNLLGFERMQQIVRINSHLPARPFEITEVRFRRTQVDATDLATTLSVDGEVWLSTTSAGEAGDFSTTFADNLGADATKVFDGTLSVAAAVAVDLAFDDLVIPVSPPFPFDPSEGYLLVDVRIPTPDGTLKFDCKNDATIMTRFKQFEGPPTEANNYSGCGLSMQLVVQ